MGSSKFCADMQPAGSDEAQRPQSEALPTPAQTAYFVCGVTVGGDDDAGQVFPGGDVRSTTT